MTVLVTGGAGYIGAHVVRLLTDRGVDVVVVDDLTTGARDRIVGAQLVEADIAHPKAVEVMASAMREHGVRDVIHFAARKRVDESVSRPAWYFQQNVAGLANVILAMEQAGADRLVFSSSAAVYGNPTTPFVDEASPLVPVNPYGESKLAGEWLVHDAAQAGVLRGIALRYFNVAGAGWDDLGDPAVLNLVTMVLERLQRGEPPRVFGTDYPTPDGSCVRDFVHVADLAEAHVVALDHLARGSEPFDAVNIGTGRGLSVLDVVNRLVRLTGSTVEPVLEPRRAGDPPEVVADVSKAAALLGWRARAGIEEILASAWRGWLGRSTTDTTGHDGRRGGRSGTDR